MLCGLGSTRLAYIFVESRCLKKKNMWWGFSPALDLREELERALEVRSFAENLEEINVLLVGSADARHILKTLAQTYRHANPKKIHFYVYEAGMDLVARQIMLLTLALEPPEEVGLLEKTRSFLELYGNTLLRPTTANYIKNKARQFVHMVTDSDYQQKRMPLIDLEQLKYRERDYLENVFKFWQKPKSKFPISVLWDNRIRKHLGTRYDSRTGVFDWDYYMRLITFGFDNVTPYEYKNWRQMGVAYMWLETEATEPNLTLATGAVQIGDTLCHHGYLGDIIGGPYAAYTSGCEDAEMLRSINQQKVKRAADIAERNVMRIMHELCFNNPFIPKRSADEDHQGVIITEINESAPLQDDSFAEDEASEDAEISRKMKPWEAKETYSAIPVNSAKVTFLPISAIKDYPKKARYQKFFHIISISHNLTDFFNEELMNMASDLAMIIIESKLLSLELNKDGMQEKTKSIQESARACHCVPMQDFSPLKDTVFKFTFNRHLQSDISAEAGPISDVSNNECMEQVQEIKS